MKVPYQRYAPFQSDGVVMTPHGELWFKASDYKPDFSHRVSDAAWLVHELTHAWQHQTGRWVRARGFFEQMGRAVGSDPYLYGSLEHAQPFASYKDEQQAAIVED